MAADPGEEGSGSEQRDKICLNSHHNHGFCYKSEPIKDLADCSIHATQLYLQLMALKPPRYSLKQNKSPGKTSLHGLESSLGYGTMYFKWDCSDRLDNQGENSYDWSALEDESHPEKEHSEILSKTRACCSK